MCIRDSPTRVSRKGVPQERPKRLPYTRVSHKSILQDYKRVFQERVPQECPAGVSIIQECPARVSYKSVSRECPTRVSYKSFLQGSPTRVSYKSVAQERSTRVSVIQGVPQECTRVSHQGYRKTCVLQECPTQVSQRVSRIVWVLVFEYVVAFWFHLVFTSCCILNGEHYRLSNLVSLLLAEHNLPLFAA